MLVADVPAHHAAARIDRVERTVFRAINRARNRHGLPGLRLVIGISRVAAGHSSDLARHHFMSHSSSDGTSFSTRIRRAANARSVGETLIEFRGHYTGSQIVRAWMHSPPHRAALLAPAFGRMGVGRANTGRSSFVTADFASGH